MYNKFYIGIDNGSSGSIGMIATSPTAPIAVHYVKTPVKKEQNYTKKAANISRIDVIAFNKLLNMIPRVKEVEVHILLERPMVNPQMFQTTISAVRILEAQLIAIEALGLPYQYIDSKEWQKKLLPAGTKGSDALKAASLVIGERLYPGKLIKGHKDADGLLIAHYCMLKNKI